MGRYNIGPVSFDPGFGGGGNVEDLVDPRTFTDNTIGKYGLGMDNNTQLMLAAAALAGMGLYGAPQMFGGAGIGQGGLLGGAAALTPEATVLANQAAVASEMAPIASVGPGFDVGATAVNAPALTGVTNNLAPALSRDAALSDLFGSVGSKVASGAGQAFDWLGQGNNWLAPLIGMQAYTGYRAGQDQTNQYNDQVQYSKDFQDRRAAALENILGQSPQRARVDRNTLMSRG